MDSKVYEDFEPFCKWETSTSYDILKVYLQGFQKEQIKIEINSKNELIIDGERPADISPNRVKRFRKEIRVSPKEYDLKEIDANFEADCLSIFMPRKARLHTMFAEQILSLKHFLRQRPEIPKTNSGVQVITAVSLGIALGMLFAFKFSHNTSEPRSKT